MSWDTRVSHLWPRTNARIYHAFADVRPQIVSKRTGPELCGPLRATLFNVEVTLMKVFSYCGIGDYGDIRFCGGKSERTSGRFRRGFFGDHAYTG